MGISLLKLEKDSNHLLELFRKRPIPKIAWKTFAELTTQTASQSRMYYSYYMQWMEEFPDELSDEDIAGINPNLWLYIYDEWVIKAGSKWVDVPEFVKTQLTIAHKKSMDWIHGVGEFPHWDGVWIPVVEEVIGNNDIMESNGRLRCLQLLLNEKKQSVEDRLVMERVEGNSPEDDITLKIISQVSKSWIELNFKEKVIIDGLVRYRDRSGIQTGSSLALGASVCLTEKTQKNLYRPEHYDIKTKEVAFTGSLREDGYVLNVDVEGLKTKVTACFYSWITHLVVPFKQIEIAEKQVQELQKEWPSKSLRIIGVNQIDDVFVNRRLVTYKRDNLIWFGIKWAWRHKNSWLGWGSAAVLALVLFRIGYGPLDKNPSYVDGEGELIQVKNKRGQVLKEFEAGQSWVSEYKRFLFDNFTLIDIDNDGQNEIFYLENDYTDSVKSKVNLYKIGNENPIWSYEPTHDVTYPRIMGSETGQVEFGKIKVRRLDKAKLEVFFTFKKRGTFNEILQKIDFETKIVKEQYVHAGGIVTMNWYDMNQDGKDELVLTAINNSLFSGSLIVLNPDHIDGNGVFSGDYISSYPNKANELAYIKIKNSIISEPLGVLKYPFAYIYETSQFSRKHFQVHVYDLHGATDEKNNFQHVYFSITFNYDLKPISIITSDPYDVLLNRYQESGELKQSANFEYWQEYMKTKIQHWDGKAWQNGGGWVNGK